MSWSGFTATSTRQLNPRLEVAVKPDQLTIDLHELRETSRNHVREMSCFMNTLKSDASWSPNALDLQSASCRHADQNLCSASQVREQRRTSLAIATCYDYPERSRQIMVGVA